MPSGFLLIARAACPSAALCAAEAARAHAREIEALAHLDDPHASAITALRSRTLARFTELEDERATINTQLAGLAKTAPQAGDPALLDALPLLGDLLAGAPARLQQQLYQAFDLQALYNKNLHQVTIHITITDTTTQAVAAIISNAGHDPQANPADPDHPAFSDLAQAPIAHTSLHDHGTARLTQPPGRIAVCC